MKSKIKIISVLGSILLAFLAAVCISAAWGGETETYDADASASAYAGNPSAAQLASIGYRIDNYGYSIDGDTSTTIFFNGAYRTFVGKTSVNVLRYGNSSCLFFTTLKNAPRPGLYAPGTMQPGYDSASIKGWSNNLTFSTPQSLNDLYLDGSGKIYYPYRDHNGVSQNYYLGSSGFTPNPSEGSSTATPVAKPTAQNFVYNGAWQYGVPSGAGYTLTGNYYASSVGTFTAYAALQAGYQWSDGTSNTLTLTWSISAAGIGGAAIGVPSQTYTGAAITPIPSVSWGGRALVNGTDYTVGPVGDTTNVGTRYVRITGRGNFTGYVDKPFSILPANIQSATVTLAQTSYTYSGTPCTPAVSHVVFNGKILTAGTDYVVTYKNNTDAGIGYAVLTGRGNFAGYTKEVPFAIAQMSVSGAVVAEIDDVTYTGAAITPKPSVTAGGKVLTEGTEFTYSYSGNTHQGTATVTVTGRGNYTGSVSKTFGITKKNLSSGIGSSAIPAVTYTGGAHTPKPVLTYNGKTLAEGTDYTLSYAGNTNAGQATVTVTGQGDYSGTLPLHFTVNKADQTFLPSGSVTIEALSGSAKISLGGVVSTEKTVWSIPAGSRVASVDQNGNLKAGNKVGTVTVTISNPGDANYNPRTQTVTVTTALTNGFFIGSLTGENTVYPSLQAAFDAVPDGGTVYAAGSPTLPKTANVTGKNVTLAGYGAGATLSRKGYGGSMLSVGDGAGLTIEKLTLDGKNVSGDPLVVSAGSLTLGDGARLINGKAGNGGAVKANGGSLVVRPGASFVGNTASGNGGAIYIADGVAASILGGAMSNNSAAVGKAVYIENGELSLAGSAATAGITDSIGIGGTGKITLTGKLTHKISVEFADPSSQMTEEAPYRNYVESKGGALSGAEMKQYLRVVNPGYTFNGEAAAHALVLQKSKTEVARFTDTDGVPHSFFDLQTAIDGAAALDGNVTVELVQYKNDYQPSLNSNTIELASALKIPAGANIRFQSIVKHTDGTGADYVYESAVSPTVLKRADNLTGEMILVEKGGKLALGNVALDGGAVWGDDGTPKVEDDGNGGAWTAVTNNKGVKAHAPVIVNRGTLEMGAGAEIRNNDNNYAKPGEGFGSQNYGGGVRNEGAGQFTMTGGAIRNCYSREGGAVMNVNKPLKDKDGNYVPEYVENGNPAVIVSGGTISGNISQMKGSAVQTIYGGANTLISGTAVITGNNSLHDLGTLAVEEGGNLTISGGAVTAGGDNKNAVYIYNKYGAENYDKESASKPFIENDNPARFTLSGSPTLGGADRKGGDVFLDNPCYVVDPVTGDPSTKFYRPVVELNGYTGGKVNVVPDANRAYGDAVISNGNNLTDKVNFVMPSSDTEYSHSDRYIYVSHEDGAYRLKYGGYDFDIDQTEPGKLTVVGVCDPSIDRIVVSIGNDTYELSVTGGEIAGDGSIVAPGRIAGEIDLTGTEGVSFDASSKAFDASGTALSEDFSVRLNAVKFDPATGEIKVPDGALYLDETGNRKQAANGTLPNDIGIDGRGCAGFIVDGAERNIFLGIRADEITKEELPETLGDRNDLTNTTVTIDGKEGYEYNLTDEDGNFVGSWKGVENAGPDGKGTVVFEGLTPGESYTVAVRRPAVLSPGSAVEKIPGKYVVTDKTATALTDGDAAKKKAFEDAYEAIKDRLLKTEGGTVTEPTASSADIKTVKDLYDRIAGIDQIPGLPGIIEKTEHLNESYDHALANEWKTANKDILGKASDALEIGDKTSADDALDGYETLTAGAKALVSEEYADLVGKKKTVAALEIAAAERLWTSDPNHGSAEEIGKLADDYLAKIGETNETTASVKSKIDLLTEQALASLEVRGKYDGLLAENSKLTETGKQTLGDLLQTKLSAIETADGEIENTKNGANAEILLRWQKESAKYEYREAFEAIDGRLPIASETAEADAAVENAENLSQIDSVLGDAVKRLLDKSVVEKDSPAAKKLVADAKTAVDNAVNDAVLSESVADVSAAVGTIRTDLRDLRTAEKADAQRRLDEEAQEILGNLSADSRSEADNLIAEAKRQIDEGYFADYPLISEKALLKLEVLKRCDEILTAVGENDFTGTGDVTEAKDAAFVKIDAAADGERAQSEKDSGILVLDREEGILILKNYLTEDDSPEVRELVTGVDGAEPRLDEAADKAEVDQIVEETKNAVDAGRFKDKHKMRKPFIHISEADLEPLIRTQTEYEALPSEIRAVLDGEAKDAGYSDYGKLIEDRIGKATSEVKKSEIIDAENALVREHDGERVRDVLREQVGLIEAIDYAPHTADASRQDYLDELIGSLDDGFEAARVEIEHAQKQQRTENQLIRDLEERLDSAQYNDAQKEALEELLAEAKDVIDGISSADGEELDRILEDTSDALNEVPVSSVSTGEIKPDKTPTDPDGTGDYGADADADEVWGIVSNDESMPGGIKLVIDKTSNDVLNSIKTASETGNLLVAEGSALTEDELFALVDDKEIKSSLDIYLLKNSVKITEFNGKYLIKILMTPEMRSMVGLQVVYLNADGTLQVYETTTEDDKYLVFVTTHFSEFYILGEKEFNLWWLIIVLSVLLAIESVVIFLMAKRKKKDDGKGPEGKTVRMNSFAPFLLSTVILPVGAVAACVSLGSLVAVGGGVITALAIKGPLRKAKKTENAKIGMAAPAAQSGSGDACATVSEPVAAEAAFVPAPEPARPVVFPVPAPAARPVVVPIVVPAAVPVSGDRLRPLSVTRQSRIVIRYRKSFSAKLIQSEDFVKDYYSELKNEIMAYGVKCRMSWRGETFRKGNKLVRIQFKGQMPALSFALIPGNYAGTKYKVEDMSDVATGKDLPCVYRIRNARRVGYAKDLIADVMTAAGLTRQERAITDYRAKFPYEETEPLIRRGLIKVLTDEPSRSGTTFKKDAARPSVTATEAASLMRDEAAAALVEEGVRIADKTKTGIVNIDTLGKYFEKGETVTLAEMKKRIPALNKKTTYVKVLARGTLDKALTVDADDFSLDAAKMILLTGGKVVRSRRA